MILLKKEKVDVVVKNRHPWIFSGALKKVTGEVSGSAPVPVYGRKDEVIGWGLYSESSRIALRMISFGPENPGEGWLEERLQRAWELRQALVINSNAFRLVNAEGDFIPGLVIDVYNKTAVVRPMVKAMEREMAVITGFLGKVMPGIRIYIKRDEFSARKEDIRLINGYIVNPDDEGKGTEIIEENGLKFHVNIMEGQKTGYYIDQRRNRKLLRELAGGKRVLNLFCYTGAFSLYAAAGGAVEVVSVDSSVGALALAEKNRGLNEGLGGCTFEWVKGDVPEYLKKPAASDIIILDPPPFARKRGDLTQALKAYRYINRRAIETVRPGGFVMTFSCSGAVDKAVFLKMLFQAGRKCERNIRMVRELHGTGDHPFSIYHPEGEYLKGWLLYVE